VYLAIYILFQLKSKKYNLKLFEKQISYLFKSTVKKCIERGRHGARVAWNQLTFYTDVVSLLRKKNKPIEGVLK
jgi:hypothetical protein